MLLNFVELGGLQLSGKTMNWVEIFQVGIILDRNFSGGSYPVGNFPGGNCLAGSYPGWEFSGWELSLVGIFFDGNFPGGNCLVGVFMLPNLK